MSNMTGKLAKYPYNKNNEITILLKDDLSTDSYANLEAIITNQDYPLEVDDLFSYSNNNNTSKPTITIPFIFTDNNYLLWFQVKGKFEEVLEEVTYRCWVEEIKNIKTNKIIYSGVHAPFF